MPAKPPADPANKQPPGRPYGAKAALLASHKTLRHTHFSYVRFAIEGIALRDAWLRCLAYSGGVDDQRHFQHRLQEIGAQIRAGAAAHDLVDMDDTPRTISATLRQEQATPSLAGPVN